MGRTASDKVLRDKAFNIAKNPKYDGYQRGLSSMVYKFFDKKTSNTSIRTGNNSQNKELAEKLRKPITKKFEKQKVCSFFIVSIWGADLIKKLVFCSVLLIFIINMHGLFL